MGGFTGTVGAGGGVTAAVAGPGAAAPEEALAAWWRAARCLLRSFSDGPRWRGR